MGSVLQMMQPTAPASLAAQALCAKPQPQQLKPLPIDIHTEQHKGVSVLLIQHTYIYTHMFPSGKLTTCR